MIRWLVRLPRIVVNSAVALPIGCVIGLVWANTWPVPYFRFAHALNFAVNDVGLTFFFGVMTKHVVDETLEGGALHSWRRGLLPIVSAVGGIAVPAVVYLAFLRQVEEPMLATAWMVTCAVDVAICYLCGRLIFGRHPAVPFLVLLALCSDAIGLGIIALTNPPTIAHASLGFAIVVLGAVSAAWIRHRGAKSYWAYLFGPGVLCWLGFYVAGVHPALALVPVVPFMPHARRDPGLLADPLPEQHDTLSTFERSLAPAVDAMLFLFGLVNAGIQLHGLEAGTWALTVAVIVGRPVGVVAAASLAIAVGLHRTARIGTRELIVIGCIASTGLTMALFFSTAVLSTGPLLSEMLTGGLMTAAGPFVAWLAALALNVGRYQRKPVAVQSEATS